MAERFTDRLHQKASGIWKAQQQHPFVRGIGDGTLDVEKFKYWLRQDYLFLVEYARLLSLAAARSPDLETMTRFGALLQETLATEMGLHRAYAAEFGIDRRELEQESPALTTRAYTDFLLRTASLGNFAELVAALLPCMWGFSEIGQRLAAQARPGNASYEKWIAMYSSREFAELAEWCRELLDRLAARLPERDLQRLETAFLTSSRCEWQFWEMAWRLECWQI